MLATFAGSLHAMQGQSSSRTAAEQEILNMRLITVVQHNLFDGVTQCVDKGADLCFEDERHQTALSWAVRCDHKDVARFLTSRGADINRLNRQGQTLLHEMARVGNVSIAYRLLNIGGAPDVLDNKGATALHYAAAKGNIGVATLLLASASETGVQDGIHNCTPIHYACSWDHREIVRLLLWHGAEWCPCKSCKEEKSQYDLPVTTSPLAPYAWPES